MPPDQTTPKLHYCDEQALPEWGVGPDGRPVKITSDERLPALFAEWRADACDHPIILIVHEPDSLGRAQYFERCGHCGLKLSSAIPHSAVSAQNLSKKTREELEHAAQHYTAGRRQRFNAMAAAAAERCQPANRQSYEDYLRSDDWKRRAAKILARACGVCEGCLTNAAAEVHHLTYDHIGAEFAFELVALCTHCHRRYHGRRPV